MNKALVFLWAAFACLALAWAQNVQPVPPLTAHVLTLWRRPEVVRPSAFGSDRLVFLAASMITVAAAGLGATSGALAGAERVYVCCGMTLVAFDPKAAPRNPGPLDFDGCMRLHVEANEFTGTVLVARGSEVLFSRGYGYAQAEWDVPSTPTGCFRLGSMTKPFTATAVLQLAAAGALRLDDPICLERLADVRELPLSITVDHGPEFEGQCLHAWAYQAGVSLNFIPPGKPVENAYIESWRIWRIEYNTVRPHSSLGNLAPEQYALTCVGKSFAGDR